MSAIDELLQANETYARTFAHGSLAAPPKKRLAVVTCMDTRIEPAAAFGLREGDAHVIRNAGGRVADALRSLAISQVYLGTEEVAIIHHTDCGMSTFTDDDIRARLRERGAIADHIAFLPFRDVEQSVRDDLALYRSSPIVRQDVVLRGFVYDVRSGRLHEVT